MPSASVTYNAERIAETAASAGFDKSENMLTTAVAIALAESSGRTAAVSPTGCCHGLWQINVNVHPYTKSQMQDPQQNAAAAYKISKQGTNWKPWSVYNNGMYLLRKPAANKAAKSVISDGGAHPQSPGDVIQDELEDIGNPAEAIMQPVTAVKDWFSDRNNIFRIIKVVAGIVVTVVGVNMLLRQPAQVVMKELKPVIKKVKK